MLVTPALLASPFGKPPPAPTPDAGTHAESVLFQVSDHLGSAILAVDRRPFDC